MKKRVFRLIFMSSTMLVVLVTIPPIQAIQQGPMDWAQAYGGSDYDGARSIIQTPTGDFILIGWTYSGGAGSEDVLLAKYAADGELQWSQTYGGRNYDRGLASLQLPDGSFAITGYTSSIGAGTKDFMLLKLTAAYQSEWIRAYGGSAYDIAYDIIQTADGGFILVGETLSGGAGSKDALLVKTAADGELEWMQTYGGKGWDYAESVIPTNDGGFAIAGSTTSYSLGGTDAWLVKLDAGYQLQWVWTYGGNYDERIYDIFQTADDGFLLAGYTSSAEGYWDGLLVKIQANGQTEWVQTYGSTGTDYIREIIPTPEGGYALISNTASYGSGNLDFWLVKIDSSGNIQWDETYGGKQTEYSYAGLLTSDGGFALAGSTSSFGSGKYDMWVVKTPPLVTTTAMASLTKSPVFTPAVTMMTISPGVSFTLNPAPLLTPMTLTTEPDSPESLTDGPMETIDITTTIDRSITFTAGPKTVFETTTSTPATISVSESTPALSVTTPPETSQAPVTVTVTDTETEAQPPQIPGFTSLPVLFAIVVSVVLFRRRRS